MPAILYIIMWSITVIAIIAIVFLIYASCSIKAGIYVKSRCSIGTAKKCVLLTFDDGPHPTQTEKVLDVLKKHNAKGAFFLIGKNAEQYPHIVKRIMEEGHVAGSHSYSHAGLYPLWSYKKIEEDLHKGVSAIEKFEDAFSPAAATHKKSKFFRPPFGVTNPPIAKAIGRLGLISIGWSIRSFDTTRELSRPLQRKRIIGKVCRKLSPGAIILLHDRLEYSHILLDELICAIKAKGYSIEGIGQCAD